jgi:hypothetical protein
MSNKRSRDDGDDGDDEDDVPPSKKSSAARPDHLIIRLPHDYIDILPDLHLIDVPVKVVKFVDKRQSYLYRICSLILDCRINDIAISTTASGIDTDDTDCAWELVDCNDKPFDGGVYLCQPARSICTFQNIADA